MVGARRGPSRLPAPSFFICLTANGRALDPNRPLTQFGLDVARQQGCPRSVQAMSERDGDLCSARKRGWRASTGSGFASSNARKRPT